MNYLIKPLEMRTLHLVLSVFTLPFTAIYFYLAFLPFWAKDASEANAFGLVHVIFSVASFFVAPIVAAILIHAGWFLSSLVRTR